MFVKTNFMRNALFSNFDLMTIVQNVFQSPCCCIFSARFSSLSKSQFIVTWSSSFVPFFESPLDKMATQQHLKSNLSQAKERKTYIISGQYTNNWPCSTVRKSAQTEEKELESRSIHFLFLLLLLHVTLQASCRQLFKACLHIWFYFSYKNMLARPQ
jgi:hypothetical protein